MAAIFGEGKIFGKLQRLHSLDPLWVENFAEIALSRTVKEIEANLCFAIFGKNSKIQNGRHFWGGEIFLKIANITFLRYPVGRKFRRNRSISHGKGDRSKFCVLPFLAKIRKFKMAAIFGEGKIFWQLQILHSLDTLWVENFDEIALSRTVKEIEANLCFAIFGEGKFFLKIANITFLRYPVGRKFRRNRSISHG